MSNHAARRPPLPARHELGVWLVVLTGVVLALVGAWNIRLTGMGEGLVGMGFELFVDVGLPLVSIGIVWYVTRTSGLPDRPIARWTFGGIAILVLLGVWASYTDLLAGAYGQALGTLVLGANLGFLFGVVTGINRARAQENAALVERERAQREGLALVNHLIRHHVLNGMTIINGYTDELREEGVDDEHVEVIERQSDRIVTLVENVQTLVESLSEAVEPRPVDAAEVAERAAADARETAPNADVHLQAESASVKADEFLRAVLDNLLSNAIDHHDGDPEVTVTVEADDPVVIRVADDGPGIPADVRESFAEKDDLATAVAGEGLGLYLVHTLVTNYGGTVDISDNQPRGVVVTVELPQG